MCWPSGTRKRKRLLLFLFVIFITTGSFLYTQVGELYGKGEAVISAPNIIKIKEINEIDPPNNIKNEKVRQEIEPIVGNDGKAEIGLLPVRKVVSVKPDVIEVEQNIKDTKAPDFVVEFEQDLVVEVKPTFVVRNLSDVLNPAIKDLIREYAFQPVRNERNEMVNIILVRSFMSDHNFKQYEEHKNDILFMGISSMEDYPLCGPNPFSMKFLNDKYVGVFPGFLHMFRDTSVFPNHVKLLLLSQSDFSLPNPIDPVPKIYDFTFSGSDQDIYNNCVGWSSFAKNLSFFYDAIEMMCNDGMTGVYVASKKGELKCNIPPACEGKVTQTFFLPQDQFFDYLKQSHFLFLPQVHDASPRVSTQAMALNIPMLMNYHIMGGWKYLNERTGEFFHDLTDIRAAYQRIKANKDKYDPRKYLDETTGNAIAGSRLYNFVMDNFAHHIKLPEGTTQLFPSGA